MGFLKTTFARDRVMLIPARSRLRQVAANRLL